MFNNKHIFRFVGGIKRPSPLIPVMIAALVLFSAPSSAVTQQINFQGRVTNVYGTPESGAKTADFKLFDSETGITQVGSTITKVVTCDASGIFSATLDIDSSNFDGDRWLELKFADDASPMVPRKKIVSVPYAYRAGAAETINGALNTVTPGGGSPMSGNIAIAGGKNVTVTQSGQVITIASAVSGSGNYVLKTGDKMTGPLTVEGNVTGETFYGDASHLRNLPSGMTTAEADSYYVNINGDTAGSLSLPLNGLLVGGSQLILSGGNVGIGTSSPASKLTVAGTIEITGTGGLKFPDNTEQYTAAGGGSGWVDDGANVRLETPTDRVEIGTPSVTPTSKLWVDGKGKFNALTVTSGPTVFQSSTVHGDSFTSTSIDGTKIAGSTVTGTDVLDGTIQNSNIETYTVSGTGLRSAIAANAVDSTKILNGNVTNAKIANSTVGGSEIASDGVQLADIANNSVWLDSLMQGGNWTLTGSLNLGSDALVIEPSSGGKVGINMYPSGSAKLQVNGALYTTTDLLNLKSGVNNVSFTFSPANGAKSTGSFSFSTGFPNQCWAVVVGNGAGDSEENNTIVLSVTSFSNSPSSCTVNLSAYIVYGFYRTYTVPVHWIAYGY